jgi:hypothetical protein
MPMTIVDPREFFTIKGAVTVDKHRQFAGREELLAKGLDSLAVDGSALVLFGERGVGKTSLGWQLLGPLSGQVQLLEERRIKTVFPVGRATCVWLTCNQFMRNAADVIYSLIEDTESQFNLKAVYPEVFKNETLVQRVTQRYKLKSPIAEAELAIDPKKGTASGIGASLKASAPNDLVAFLTLKELLAKAWEKYPEKRSLVLFLDEFDQIQDRAEIGVLLKSLNNVRFVLIGIASSREKLIGHHGSIGRKLSFSAYEVPLLGLKDIDWFFDSVEQSSGRFLRFSPIFREIVAKKSSGFPWLIQQLGFYSVISAISPESAGGVQSQIMITEESYRAIIKDFLETQIGDVGFNLVNLTETQRRVLEALAGTAKGRSSEAMLIERLPSSLRQFYDQAIEKLKEADIIYEQSSEVRIKDPLTKILIDLAREEGLFRV